MFFWRGQRQWRPVLSLISGKALANSKFPSDVLLKDIRIVSLKLEKARYLLPGFTAANKIGDYGCALNVVDSERGQPGHLRGSFSALAIYI